MFKSRNTETIGFSCTLVWNLRRWVWLGCFLAAFILDALPVNASLAPHAYNMAATPTPKPLDVPYPGEIEIAVDAASTIPGLIHVHETLPIAKEGDLTLLFPQWLPGNHGPNGPLKNMGGLSVSAGGRPVAWRRDPVDVFAFHIKAPKAVRILEIDFDFLSPTDPSQGRIVKTRAIADIQWTSLILYPAGYFSRRISVRASLRLPAGWSYATSLNMVTRDGDTIGFQPVDLETLADLPVLAGQHFRQVDLNPGASIPVHLDLFADRSDELVSTPEQIRPHRELIGQAYKLFGRQPFDHYDFLIALSDRMGGIGLEHQSSSEDVTPPDYFAQWDDTPDAREWMPHEFTHAWNGKYRRPADLWTSNFNMPIRGSLLWVYEGQTKYWGYVLSGRSGLLSRQQALDQLAATAALCQNRPGRAWRTVEDTTADPIVVARRSQPWISWQRSEDYYAEGLLVWLDVDTLIRQRSGNRRSLDDFAGSFFGKSGKGPNLYTFNDVVDALSRVEPYDWTKFFENRIYDLDVNAPLDGLRRGGWSLIYTEEPTEFFRLSEAHHQIVDLTYSIGMVLGPAGQILQVQWGGPSFQARLAVGSELLAVNGVAYNVDRLKAAVTRAKRDRKAINLLVQSGTEISTVSVSYFGGLRYPRLARLSDKPDLLSQIYAPR